MFLLLANVYLWAYKVYNHILYDSGLKVRTQLDDHVIIGIMVCFARSAPTFFQRDVVTDLLYFI